MELVFKIKVKQVCLLSRDFFIVTIKFGREIKTWYSQRHSELLLSCFAVPIRWFWTNHCIERNSPIELRFPVSVWSHHADVVYSNALTFVNNTGNKRHHLHLFGTTVRTREMRQDWTKCDYTHPTTGELSTATSFNPCTSSPISHQRRTCGMGLNCIHQIAENLHWPSGTKRRRIFKKENYKPWVGR